MSGDTIKISPSTGQLDFSEAALNKTVLTLAIPAVIEYVLFTVVRVTDTLIVGNLYVESELAAVGFAQSIIFFGNSPFFALAVAATSMVARRLGEGNIAAGRRLAGQFMAIAFALSLITMIAGMVMAHQMLIWMNAEPDVAVHGALYLRIILLSSVVMFPLFVGNGILRGAGDTRTPMMNTGLMNAVNIGVSIILAFGLGPFPWMGLVGVAWGTVAGNLAGSTLMMVALMRRSGRIRMRWGDMLSWKDSRIGNILGLSWPVMMERFVGSGSFIVFMGLVAYLGTTAVAAHNIALRIEALAYMPAIGLSFAITSLVSQALGAGRGPMAAILVRRSLGAAAVVMFSMSVIFLLFAAPMVSLFGATPGVLGMAAIAVRVSVLELPFIAFGMILAGALRGAGDTKTPLLAMIFCILVFRFVGVYFLGIKFGLGIGGVWLATAIDWAMRAVIMWHVFRRGAWMNIKV